MGKVINHAPHPRLARLANGTIGVVHCMYCGKHNEDVDCPAIFITEVICKPCWQKEIYKNSLPRYDKLPAYKQKVRAMRYAA